MFKLTALRLTIYCLLVLLVGCQSVEIDGYQSSRIPIGLSKLCSSSDLFPTTPMCQEAFQVAKINIDVNRGFTSAREAVENWAPASEGIGGADCDSYASEKMLRLMQFGVKGIQLSLVTAWIEPDKQVLHAVLFYRDAQNNIHVLDNLTDTVKLLPQVDYDWDYIPNYIMEGTRYKERAI